MYECACLRSCIYGNVGVVFVFEGERCWISANIHNTYHMIGIKLLPNLPKNESYLILSYSHTHTKTHTQTHIYIYTCEFVPVIVCVPKYIMPGHTFWSADI